MQTDQFKYFIEKHRDALDAALPDAHLWQGVEKALIRWPESDELERQLISNRTLLDQDEPSIAVWDSICTALDAPADPLEAFIKNNREAFDAEQPAEGLWNNIASASTKNQAPQMRISWGRRIMQAAAAITILICGIGLGMWYAGHQTPENNGMAMSDVSSEYAELERYYQSDIEQKKGQLAEFASYQDESVLEDLKEMDRIMEELRLELEQVTPANREKVVRAMIENYKSKVTILQRVLQHLNEQSNDSTNSSNNEIESI